MQFAPRRRRRPAIAITALLTLVSAGLGVPAHAEDDLEAAVNARYPPVLTLLANGEHDRALTALRGMESQLTAGGPLSRFDKLWKAKLHVLRDLIDNPEVLVPAIQLHHDAFVAYRAEGQTLLARHSRTMATELAEVYVDRANSEAARVVAGRALASLGGYQQEDGSIGSAAELFLEAIKLDPKCGAGLLGQAALYEKLGQYKQALPLLEALSASQHGNSQARLRLAMNLARTGDRARAQTTLAGLLKSGVDAADAASPWVVALAYEEQARMLTEDGALRPAIDILRRGAERFPANPEMLISQAFLLERAGEPGAAQALVERAAKLAGSTAQDAPRWLYNRWPQDELDEARKRLRESTEPRLKLLAAALKGEGDTIITVTEEKPH